MSARYAALALGCLLGASCGRDAERTRLAQELTGGDVTRGERAFRRYGCGNCHEVAGAFMARGHAGPALHDFAFQLYLPGGRPNTPPALVEWLRHPRAIAPGTAMPELGVTQRDAEDLAAYLYALE